MDITGYCTDLGSRARVAARELATVSGDDKDRWLRLAADRLDASHDAMIAANARDLEKAPEYGLTGAQIDRLRLTVPRLKAAAEGLRQVAALPDPVGEIIE